jgi:hypothetical protein
MVCDVKQSTKKWSNQPSTWACLDAICSGLTFNSKRYCSSGGNCPDIGQWSCNDNNICTDDTCSAGGAFSGCSNSNNTAVYDNSCYTAAASTKGVGPCKGGTEYCQGGKNTGTCIGEVTPVAEVCDGQDNDCAGGIDNGVLKTFYKDVDGDGFGDPNKPIIACTAPPGYVE